MVKRYDFVVVRRFSKDGKVIEKWYADCTERQACAWFNSMSGTEDFGPSIVVLVSENPTF